MPDAKSLAAVIKEIQTRCSNARIEQTALEQLGRAWTLAKDVVVQVPDDSE